MPLLWLLLGAWAVATVLTLLARRRMYAFEIRIRRDGRAIIAFGQPRNSFVADVQEIAERNALIAGKVRGVRTRGRIRLAVAGRIPEGARQQLRNAWGVAR